MRSVISAWRLATTGPTWRADELSGVGSALDPGRWNSHGVPVVYAASSIALACLETLVHVSGGLALPLNRWLVEIEIPLEQWEQRQSPVLSELVGWDATPAGAASRRWGDHWLGGGTSLLAAVPSVIVPEESNVLINPRHPACAELVTRVHRQWDYDDRLL